MGNAHNLNNELYLANAMGSSRIANPGAGGTFDLKGKTNAYVVVTATGTYALPSAPANTELLVCCDDTSDVTLADAGGTIKVFTGTSGTTACKCIATDSNSWAAKLVTQNAAGDVTAQEVSVADGNTYFDIDTVEEALGELGGGWRMPNAKFTTSSTTTTATVGAGALTGARHVFWQNTADGALSLQPRTATQMYGDMAGLGPYVGMSFLLTIVNRGDNTVTLAAATGVTYTGEQTIATLVTRTYVCTFTSATAMTIVSVLKGTIET